MEPNTGATAFLVNLWKADPAKLATANPEALARKYRIPVEWVKAWLSTRV